MTLVDMVKAPISAPQMQPLFLPPNLLMAPDPANCSPRVRHAMSQSSLGPLNTEVVLMMGEIKEGLQYVFQTKNNLTLAMSICGTQSMEAVLYNLVESHDNVLVAIPGILGDNAAKLIRNCGAQVSRIHTQTAGGPITRSDLETALQRHKPSICLVAHYNPFTGVLQPLEEFGALCHKHGCLLIVDAIDTFGAVPIFADRWNIDGIYSTSDKAIGASTGFSPMSFSPKAEEKIQRRKTPVPVYFWDLRLLRVYWGCTDKNLVTKQYIIYHHTICVPGIYALREALSEVCIEGLEMYWERLRKCAECLRKGLHERGYKLLGDEFKDNLPTITTVLTTESEQETIWNESKLSCIEIGKGIGDTNQTVIRIGVMGFNATMDNVNKVLRAINYRK